MKRKTRELSAPDRHQLKIALDTLKMNDVMARVMGGPSKEEARVIVKRLTGRAAKNPRGEKITAHDVNATKNVNGYWVLSTIKDGYRVQNVYGGYSKRDAMREFLKAVNGPEKNPGRGKVVGHFGSPRKIARAKFGPALRRQSSESEWQFKLRQQRHERERQQRNAPRFMWCPRCKQGVQAPTGMTNCEDCGMRLRPQGALNRASFSRARKRVVLRKKNARRTVKRRSNPLLGVLGNPPADSKYLGKVTRIEYTHGHDGQPYYHDFKPPVYAQVMDDGRVVLWHPTNNLWKLFDIK